MRNGKARTNIGNQLDLFETEAQSVVDAVRNVKLKITEAMADAQRTLTQLSSLSGGGNIVSISRGRRTAQARTTGNRSAAAKLAAQKLEARREYGRKRYLKLKKAQRANGRTVARRKTA